MASKQKPRRKEEWQAIIKQCQNRQGSIPKWCEENGINITTYKYWVTRLNQERKAEQEPMSTVFAKLPLPSEPAPNSPETTSSNQHDIIIRCGIFELCIPPSVEISHLTQILEVVKTQC